MEPIAHVPVKYRGYREKQWLRIGRETVMFDRLKRDFLLWFAGREKFDALIRSRMPVPSTVRIPLQDQILSAHRIHDATLAKIVPFSFRFRSFELAFSLGKETILRLFGFRHGDVELKCYWVTEGCFAECISARHGVTFTVNGEYVISGGNVLDHEFLIRERSGREFTVRAPRRKPDWDSAVQSPALVEFYEKDMLLCKTVMQPFRDDREVFKEIAPQARELRPETLMVFLAIAAISDARF